MNSDGDGKDGLSVVTSRQHISAVRSNDIPNPPKSSNTFDTLSSISSTVGNSTTAVIEG
jgi:hypothetical protein